MFRGYLSIKLHGGCHRYQIDATNNTRTCFGYAKREREMERGGQRDKGEEGGKWLEDSNLARICVINCENKIS